MYSASVWGNVFINYLSYYTHKFVFFCRDFYLNTCHCYTELCNDCDPIILLESGLICENSNNEILESLIENQPIAQNNTTISNEEIVIKKKETYDNLEKNQETPSEKKLENSWDII